MQSTAHPLASYQDTVTVEVALPHAAHRGEVGRRGSRSANGGGRR